MKSGFVAVVGKPNVGKSTLVNRMVGRPVSITSPKPETTRRRILGVVHGDDHQIVLVDTPGLSPARHALGRMLRDAATTEGQEADLLLFCAELTHFPTDEDRDAFAQFAKSSVPRFLVGTKVDRHKQKDEMLPFLQAYAELGNFDEVFPVSAVTGENVDRLLEAILARLPEGVPYFPPDMISDLDQASWVEELIREQVLLATRQEIPHAVAVKVEQMGPGEENPNVLAIRAFLYVERESQKKILIGKKGEQLKSIGQKSRQRIEQELGKKVYLDLWVKVKEDWRNREDWVRTLY